MIYQRKIQRRVRVSSQEGKDNDYFFSNKMNRGDRVSFLNDYEYVADALPGPGNYNPRVLIFEFRPWFIYGI